MSATETITWRSPKHPPRNDRTVLVRIRSSSPPVWLGYRDEGTWRTVDGEEVAFPVVEWAELPEGSGR